MDSNCEYLMMDARFSNIKNLLRLSVEISSADFFFVLRLPFVEVFRADISIY